MFSRKLGSIAHCSCVRFIVDLFLYLMSLRIATAASALSLLLLLHVMNHVGLFWHEIKSLLEMCNIFI